MPPLLLSEMTENIQSTAFYGGPADLQRRLIMNYKQKRYCYYYAFMLITDLERTIIARYLLYIDKYKINMRRLRSGNKPLFQLSLHNKLLCSYLANIGFSMAILIHEIVYFIQGEKTKLVKIGKTSNTIPERLAKLQTGSPDKLRLIGICFGPTCTERMLHNKFKEHRRHGEWFFPSSELTRFVEVNCFKNINAADSAYLLCNSDKLKYEDAVAMSCSELEKLCQKIDMTNINTDEIYTI